MPLVVERRPPIPPWVEGGLRAARSRYTLLATRILIPAQTHLRAARRQRPHVGETLSPGRRQLGIFPDGCGAVHVKLTFEMLVSTILAAGRGNRSGKRQSRGHKLMTRPRFEKKKEGKNQLTSLSWQCSATVPRPGPPSAASIRSHSRSRQGGHVGKFAAMLDCYLHR